MTDTNDAAAPAGGAPQGGEGQTTGEAQPGLSIIAQYIKDLSFENPNSPRSLQPQGQPKLDINVNVNATPFNDNQFEVVLTLNAKANNDAMALFVVELVYAGLIKVSGVPQEHLHPFVMIEAPRIIFPFARNILAEATRNGGFPPLMLDPIDFAALYRQNLQQQQAAGAGEGGAPQQPMPN
ncbi:protein-export chaperone SecB [Rhizobiales bacterium]|uniref:protein-export chaperone SecB n=1 Tax=Hongsoonwoonella zoysiae TaxID=2821844 RepID=UPI001561864D|nr:protein-export chaperone SecB [Hongsoonwoonella zoysiae]NRG16741.1 protein-export chaperone SecB [Hongsoonwoonella zoysiae]